MKTVERSVGPTLWASLYIERCSARTTCMRGRRRHLRQLGRACNIVPEVYLDFINFHRGCERKNKRRQFLIFVGYYWLGTLLRKLLSSSLQVWVTNNPLELADELYRFSPAPKIFWFASSPSVHLAGFVESVPLDSLVSYVRPWLTAAANLIITPKSILIDNKCIILTQ